MKFFATVALLATAVAAAPSQKLFNLRTSGSSNSSHNDLYLSVGHGLASDPLNSEAVFSGASASNAAAFSFINGTIILDTEAKSPWTLDLISVEGKLSPVLPLNVTVTEPRSLTILVLYRHSQGARPDQRQTHFRLGRLLYQPPGRSGTQ